MIRLFIGGVIGAVIAITLSATVLNHAPGIDTWAPLLGAGGVIIGMILGGLTVKE